MSATKTFSFEGIDNFRDFGGFIGRYGQVAAGRLFRSAQTSAATAADLSRLEELGLAVVADLRRPAERQRQPGVLPAAFAGRRIASDLDDRAEAPHIEFLRQGDLNDGAVEAYLLGYYRQAPFQPAHLAVFRETFAALAEGEGALLVHCTAGKDRTGLLAALVQKALGASEDDVLQDYLESNARMLTEARIAQAAANLEQAIGHPPGVMVVRGFLGVEPHYLHAAFAEIDTRAGGLIPYFAQLGLDEPRLEQLRTRLIA